MSKTQGEKVRQKFPVRFSLGGLMLVVTLAAVVLAKRSNDVRRRSEVIARRAEAARLIGKHRGVVLPESNVATKVRSRNPFALEEVPRVSSIQFSPPSGTPLNFQPPEVNDDVLAELTQFPELKTLRLGGARLITDRGLARLRELPELNILDLYGATVQGSDLRNVAALSSLEIVSLQRSNLNDAGLHYLARLPNLKSLNLDYTDVTDAGLKALASASSLESLSLHRTRVSDAAVPYLVELRNLKQLNLIATQVTRKGVTTIRRELPMCTVMYWDRKGFFDMKPRDELLFPPGYQPSSPEIKSRLRQMGYWVSDEEFFGPPGGPVLQIRLAESTLSDRALLELVRSLPSLASIIIERGLVGDEFLRGIRGLPIRILHLHSTRITDAGLAHLADLPKLEALTLDGNDITDEGGVHLQKLSGLIELSIADTLISNDGIDALRKALPDDPIHW